MYNRLIITSSNSYNITFHFQSISNHDEIPPAPPPSASIFPVYSV